MQKAAFVSKSWVHDVYHLLTYRPAEALEAYEKALSLDQNNAQAKQGLQSVQRAIDAKQGGGAGGADGLGGLGNVFNDPNMIQKLASNPKTSSLLADAEFIAKLQKLQANPGAIVTEMNDPRILQVMGVLMGFDLQMKTGDDVASGMGGATEAEEDVPMPDARSRSPPKKAPTPQPEPEPEPEDEEAIAKRQAKEKADEEKKLGNENYKKRNFDQAISHYDKAWEIYQDITYLNNLGAAKFEKGDYQGAIEACQKAVEHGREVLADFKLIAKYVNSSPPKSRKLIVLQGVRKNRFSIRKDRRSSKRYQQLSKIIN